MKQCTKCKIEKELSEFYKDSQKIDNLSSHCIDCCKLYKIKSKKHRSLYWKNYYKNKEILLKKSRKTIRDNYPWIHIYWNIHTRCNCEKFIEFHRYGGRGIKALITQDEIKELWFRDKAWLLERPSIDRIDNDGDYTFENCQFIEISENIRRKYEVKKN